MNSDEPKAIASSSDAQASSSSSAAPAGDGEAAANPAPNCVRNPRYPLNVLYCPICLLPPELYEYHPKSQFEKCKGWLSKHAPHYFPEQFPDECAARLEKMRIAEENGEEMAENADDDDTQIDDDDGKKKKVATPIEQKTSGGKKKKTPAEIVLMLGQRKGKKQVTVVYGLDLFGIKLKEAAKAAKRKFATGSSLTMSADNREVIEIQGSRQEDMAALIHKEWGVPQESIFIVNAQKKKVKAFA